MVRSWVIPLGIADLIIALLVFVADLPDWGRGAAWAAFVAVLLPTLILRFWMVDREEKRRASAFGGGRRRPAR
jgi:hypothetical protein